MEHHSEPGCTGTGENRRNLILKLVALALLYPIFRFIGHAIPKKPTYVKISTPLPPTGYLVTSDFILFDRDNSSWAISRKCTHLGCKLRYSEVDDILECPCHQSQFLSSTGAVLQGPAKKSLALFTVEKHQKSPFYVVKT